MKRLYPLFVILLGYTSMLAQDMEFKVPATVKVIAGDSAYVMSRNYGKTFVIAKDSKSSFPIYLVLGREYSFKLVVDKDLRERLHCSGCTGNLPAVVKDYVTSSFQNSRDIARFDKENP